MGSQADGRISTEARTSTGDHGSRDLGAQDYQKNGFTTSTAGGTSGANIQGQSQRILGTLPENENATNGSPQTSALNGRVDMPLENTRDIAVREKPRSQSTTEAKKSAQRTCKKCGEPLTGQFVRALDGTFHLDCFRCEVGVVVHAAIENADILRSGLRSNCSVKILSLGQ